MFKNGFVPVEIKKKTTYAALKDECLPSEDKLFLGDIFLLSHNSSVNVITNIVDFLISSIRE